MFLVGYCVYIAIEVTIRSYSYPLMGVVAGIAVILLDKINDYISWDIDLLIQASIGSAFITSMEFIIGNMALRGIVPQMWDYSGLPFNYRGIICLPFSLIWILMSCIAIFVADAINYYIFDDPTVPHYILFGKFVIVFKSKEQKEITESEE